MTRVLLEACLCVLAIGVLSKPYLESPCTPLQSSDNARVTTLLGGRAALITCRSNTQRLAFCLAGRWSSNASCSNDRPLKQSTTELDQSQEISKVNSKEYGLTKREKRNTGKYQELRRRVKVQRKIRAGLLETRIDTSIPSIFRAHTSGNVYLPCRIENLGAHSVTWLRVKDNRVLAIDTSVLNGDLRLSPSYEEKTETWLLGIRGARESDDGRYECRVSTRPPLKRVVTLQVIPADQPLHGPVQADARDLDFVLRNITALWEEIHDVREEINHHLHNGHTEDGHDKALHEVEKLNHEHHVHHLHHPHRGHNDHHDAALLQHLEQVHRHLDDHSEGQPIHGHVHGHGHAHDHHHGEEEGDDHSHEDHDHEEGHDHAHSHGEKHHDHEDIHDAHGLHSHEDESEYGHEHEHHHSDSHPHPHDHAEHDHTHDGEPDSHDHAHDGDHDDHDHAHDGDHDDHDHAHDDDHDGHDHAHDSDHDDHDHAHDDDHSAPRARPGLAVIPGRPRPGTTIDDPWMHASCTLKPNVDMPTSNVKGSIIISQTKDGKGPVYFDLHITGMDVATTGSTHGFHVHELAVTDGSCGSTGGHFNPEGVVHGAPEDEVRHVGDLGNVEVGENGELHGYIFADDKVSFNGPNSIIGKAIVVHAGVDDLGKGGDAGSLTTGNAGGRLACCTIYMAPQPHGKLVTFRFKG